MTTGAKLRVYEIARDVGLPNKELIAKIRALGLEVNNHMSSLDADDVARVKRSLEKERLASTETKRLSSTVLRRRSKGSEDSGNGTAVHHRVEVETREEPPARSAPVRRRKVETDRPAAETSASAGEAAIVRAEPPAPPPVIEPEAPPPRPPQPRVEERPPPARSEAQPDLAASAEPEAATPPPRAPAVPVVIKGPPSVSWPGRPAAPPKVERAASEKPAAAEARTSKESVAPAQPGADRGPQPQQADQAGQPDEPEHKEGETIHDVEETARSRFEKELARARARVAERERPAIVVEDKTVPVEEVGDRDPSRPAVGSVISLPMTRIKITERAPAARQVPGQGQIRGRFAQQQTRGGPRKARDFGKKRAPIKKGKSTQITTPAEHKRVIRIEETVAIPELAHSMGVKANEVLKKLWSMGMVGININASIDFETAQITASEFGYEVQNVAFKEDDAFTSRVDADEELSGRAPVVTVMGHVDHGKTSLLDAIRKTQVTKGEAGGITQHIAAYKVRETEAHGDIVFLDTPGHAAFTEMRARGAQATDIVVLVVAANDGMMPQTVEALNHAKDAKVTIIVAVNKIDLPDAQPERIRQQLADHGLIPEEWGGETIYVDVSALKHEGIDTLLEAISVSAEVLELRANPDKPALGIVIEAKLDRARGPMATVLVQEGTLRAGDIVVAGQHIGKVRALLDDKGQTVKEAGPSTPVELLGLDGVPEAGDTLNAAEDEKKAKLVVDYRRQARRKKELAETGRVSLENIMEKIQEGEAKELKVVLKADVQGSAEALRTALMNQSTEKVKVNVIQAGVGGITETDVNLAKAGGAVIVGFHVRPAGKAGKLAEQEGVQIKLYDIIYEALDEVKAAMAGLLAPIKREQQLGQAEVRDTFNIPRVGTVAGCMITQGKVQRKSLLRVVRDAVQIYEGRIASLRRFKDDASEVVQGYECGIMLDGFNDLKVGDVLEAYEIVEEAAQL